MKSHTLTPTVEQDINPTTLWKVYGIALAVAALGGFIEGLFAIPISGPVSTIAAIPMLICPIIALIYVPVRLVQSVTKDDVSYVKAAWYCGLMVILHIGLTVISLQYLKTSS